MSAFAQLMFFAIAVSVMIVAAWASKDHVVQKMSLLMLAAWAFSNIALAAVGYEREPLLVPSIDAVVAATVAYVGFVNRSRLAIVIFTLFALLACVHVVAFATYTTESYFYYLAKNAIFLTQVFIVGGFGAWVAIRTRLHPRSQRASPHIVGSR